MSTAVYVRVSTVEQNEAGQTADVQRWLDAHGIQNVSWYVDKQTGDNLDRPAFKRLQKAVFDGTVKAVVVWRIDRLSRSLRDGINTLADWADKGLRVVSVTQQLDFSGITGQLVAAVLFAVAQMEQEGRRERQKAGIAVAKAAGVYRGRKPGAVKVNRSRVVELRQKGLTVPEIQTALGCSRASVYRCLGTAS